MSPRGEALLVEVNGKRTDPDELPFWTAKVDGLSMFISFPESGGCDTRVELAGVDPAAKTIDVVANTESDGQCAANLFISTEELTVEEDVRGFTVHVLLG